jgi:hypothetical protein
MKKSIALLLLLFNISAFAQQKGSFTDPRDGKTYKIVKIGVQTISTLFLMTTLSINEDLLEQIIAMPNNSFMDFYGVFKDNPIPDKLELRKEFYEKNSANVLNL